MRCTTFGATHGGRVCTDDRRQAEHGIPATTCASLDQVPNSVSDLARAASPRHEATNERAGNTGQRRDRVPPASTRELVEPEQGTEQHKNPQHDRNHSPRSRRTLPWTLLYLGCETVHPCGLHVRQPFKLGPLRIRLAHVRGHVGTSLLLVFCGCVRFSHGCHRGCGRLLVSPQVAQPMLQAALGALPNQSRWGGLVRCGHQRIPTVTDKLSVQLRHATIEPAALHHGKGKAHPKEDRSSHCAGHRPSNAQVAEQLCHDHTCNERNNKYKDKHHPG